LCVGDWQGFIGNLMIVVYMCLIVAQVLVALGNKPSEMPMLYSFTAYFFGVYTFFTAVLSLQFIFSYNQQICFAHQDFSFPGPACLNEHGKQWGHHGLPAWDNNATNCYVQYDFSGKSDNYLPYPKVSCTQINSMFQNKPYEIVPGFDKVDAIGSYCETYCPGKVPMGECVQSMDPSHNGMHSLHIKACSGEHCPGCLDPLFLKFFGGASIGVFFAAAIVHMDILAIILNFFQYIFMLPTFINIFTIYSYCNFHDVSWGTKLVVGEETEEKKKKRVTIMAADDNETPEQKEADEKLVGCTEKKRSNAYLHLQCWSLHCPSSIIQY
jgi:hypothetical protein